MSARDQVVGSLRRMVQERDGCRCIENYKIAVDKGAVLVRCSHYDGRSLALIAEWDDWFYVQREDCGCATEDYECKHETVMFFNKSFRRAYAAFVEFERVMLEEAPS